MARDELLIREKVHTREGDALAAARRRLPMVELGGTVEVVGADGSVPFLDLFQGRDELVVYKHMWYDGAPHQGQCEGCTVTAWHPRDAVYLNARGVSFAILTTGRWDEVAAYVEFMGYTRPWYSVRGLDAPVGGPTGRPVPQWTRPGATPCRPSAGAITTTDGPSPTTSAQGVRARAQPPRDAKGPALDRWARPRSAASIHSLEPEPLIESTALRGLVPGGALHIIEGETVERRQCGEDFEHIGGFLYLLAAVIRGT